MKQLIVSGNVFVAVLILTGCTVGPKYKRPAITAPEIYRNAVQASPSSAHTDTSAEDLKWSEIFKDTEMKNLITEALAKNFDIRIAAQRILEQEAQAGIVRSQSLPSVNGGAAYSAIGMPSGLLGDASSTFHGGGFTAVASWNLDFWGLYRRQSEAARAELLATEWGRRATLSSVVMNVAASYIQLRDLDAQLVITKKIVISRKEALRLVVLRESVGTASMIEVSQSKQLLNSTEAAQPGIERQIEEQENNINLLLGRNPGPIQRSSTVVDSIDPQDVPPGIPSQLLERRPDIQRAEAKLIAANARIGVAKAQYFPQVSITGIGGSATSEFDKLFSTNSRFWFGAVNITQPIFMGGKLKNNLRLSKATEQEMVLAYQQVIASALRDVSNALVIYRKAKEYRIAQENIFLSSQEYSKLTRTRFNHGRSSYLAVLASDDKLSSVESNLADARHQESISLVQLYGALGGGWK